MLTADKLAGLALLASGCHRMDLSPKQIDDIHASCVAHLADDGAPQRVPRGHDAAMAGFAPCILEHAWANP